MAITDAAGTVLSKTALQARTTAVPSDTVTVNEDIYENFDYPNSNSARFEEGRRLLFPAGHTVKQSKIDALFPSATVTGVSPNSGPVAGGTAVTIQGTNLSGVTGVNFGANAATGVTVDSNTQVSAVTPAAAAAGVVDVAVADDAGTVTLTGGYTYT